MTVNCSRFSAKSHEIHKKKSAQTWNERDKRSGLLFFFAFNQIIFFIARTCIFGAVLNVCDYLMAINDKKRFRFYQLN